MQTTVIDNTAAASIKQVAVIGSGVMGSQIAAHIANTGVPVVLLDIVPKDARDRNILAKSALERLLKTEPMPFMHPSRAKLVTVGNLEDDLSRLATCDWIIEAVLEDTQVKSDLYRKIEAVRKDGSIVSSNTSTIPLTTLIADQSPRFAADFLISHFFNPPRYMRLLELITGDHTNPKATAAVRDFCDRLLGKGVVVCRDTPGFIANRLGMFFLQAAVNAASDMGLSVEEADAVFSKPMGMPRTGIFGLLDLVGLDLIPHIAKSLLSTIAANDEFRAVYRDMPLFQRMIADGYTGRKGKGGFYRMALAAGGARNKEAIDLQSGEYRSVITPDLAVLKEIKGDLSKLCESDDRIGRFTWAVLSQTLAYAAKLAPTISNDIASVDEAMRLGYNWQQGPFELIERLGEKWLVEKLKSSGMTVPPLLKMAATSQGFYRVANGQREQLRVDGTGYAPFLRCADVLSLTDLKLLAAAKAEDGNDSASLWNVGKGVLCLEFHTKMNAIDIDTITILQRAIALIGDGQGQWKGLVVYNEADNFSAGANLGHILTACQGEGWQALDDMIRQGQKAFQRLRYAPFPSVSAVAGLTLGGGCEIAMHCSAVQAYAESYIGLVETSVGLVPGWGGCLRMLERALAQREQIGGDITPPISRVFDILSASKRSKSAADAEDLMYLLPTDGVTMNRDRLLFDARQKVLDMSAAGYCPPEPPMLNLPGSAGRAALNLTIEGLRQIGKLGAHDVIVARSLAAVLCSGSDDVTKLVTEAQVLTAERREFINLCRTTETHARIAHTLKTGKPLRN